MYQTKIMTTLQSSIFKSLQKCADLQIAQFRMQAMFPIAGECEDRHVKEFGTGFKDRQTGLEHL